MNSIPEHVILQRYDRRLRNMNLDQQLHIITKAQRRGEELHRIVSKDAPDTLIRRFAGRCRPIIDQLSPYERGRVLTAQEKIPEAISAFEAAVAENDFGAYGALAELLASVNDPTNNERIVAYYKNAIQHGHDDHTIHNGLARIYALMERDDDAYKELDQSIQMADAVNDVAAKTYYMAQKAFFREDDQAMNLIRTAADKGDVRAVTMLVHSLVDQKEFRAAIHYIRLLIKAGITRGYITLGYVYSQLTQPANAISCYEKALQAGHTDACMPLIDLLFAQKNLDRARTICDELIASGDFNGYIGMAQIASLQGDQKSVIHSVKAAISAGHTIPFPLELVVFILDRKWGNAITLCMKNLSGKPQLHLVLAALYKQKGNTDMEKRHFDLAMKRIPDAAMTMSTVKNLSRSSAPGAQQQAKSIIAHFVITNIQAVFEGVPLQNMIGDFFANKGIGLA